MNKKTYLPRLYLDMLLKAGLAANQAADPESQKKGFILLISTDGADWQNTEIHCLGNPGDLTLTFINFASEKALRIKSMRQVGRNDRFASESKDHEQRMYAGAVMAYDEDGNEVYISVSGLKELVDEAMAYRIAESLGLKVPQNYENPHLEIVRSKSNGCAV